MIEPGYRSQIGQDVFVDSVLDGKIGGTFLDVGCYDCERISNTYFLEVTRNWRGVAIDIDPTHEQGWKLRRPRSAFVCADATLLDYDYILDQNAMPEVIDYLSMDLEPPSLTLQALERVLESRRKFRVITFETDWYRYKESREPSRRILLDAGYTLAREGNQDDFWIL